MRLTPALLLLICGLIGTTSVAAQQGPGRLEYWHTGGAGLSTPLGFNAGASFSVSLGGPLFAQASVSATKDVYITRHSVFAASPALGLRAYSETALTSLAIGPALAFGSRGLDLAEAGQHYGTAAVNIVGQVLFRDVNLGFELYANLNPVRNVSGMRLIYRLGPIR